MRTRLTDMFATVKTATREFVVKVVSTILGLIKVHSGSLAMQKNVSALTNPSLEACHTGCAGVHFESSKYNSHWCILPRVFPSLNRTYSLYTN